MCLVAVVPVVTAGAEPTLVPSFAWLAKALVLLAAGVGRIPATRALAPPAVSALLSGPRSLLAVAPALFVRSRTSLLAVPRFPAPFPAALVPLATGPAGAPVLRRLLATPVETATKTAPYV